MKHFGLLIMCVFVGVVGWRIGGELSTDAMGMAIGMLFGVMAGIPTALILLASQRRDDGHRGRHEQPRRPRVEQQPPAPPQVVNNYHNHLHLHGAQPAAPGRSRQAEVMQRHSLPGPMPEMPAPRQFRIVGQDVDETW